MIPVYPYTFPNKTVTAQAFGKDAGNFRVGFAEHTQVPPENFYPIARAAYDLGIRELFVPDPHTFTRDIVDKESFSYVDIVGGVRIRHGAIADGVMLDPGMAVAMVTGDCPTITLIARHLVGVIHGGLASLLPQPFRLGDSVVDRMMKLVPKEWHGEAKVLVSCHIGPEHFVYPMNHLEFGKINQERRDFILHEYSRFAPAILPDPRANHINIFQLIAAQFWGYGIRKIQDDGIDTAAGDSGFWSHTRGDSGRNCVIVVRK